MRVLAILLEPFGLGCRIVLEVAVEDDFVAFFVGVEPVQDVSRLGFEPTDVFRRAVARNQREA